MKLWPQQFETDRMHGCKLGHDVHVNGVKLGTVARYLPGCGQGWRWRAVSGQRDSAPTRKAAIDALIDASVPPSVHDKHNPDHLCRHCGAKLGLHAGARNPDCPDGRCPPVTVWGRAKPFPKLDGPEATVTAEIRAYWTAQPTTFQPVS
jgi:hypothetical protein